MIATNIVYFFLLSVSWMSAVSVYLTDEQIVKINRFLSRADLEINWTAAYYEIGLETLIDYFKARDEKLQFYIGRYARSVNFHEIDHASDEFRFSRCRNFHRIDGETFAPDPDPEFINELRGLRKLVFVIRDANLRIINDIKQAFSEDTHLHPRLAAINERYPMLAAINDQMIQSVASRYAVVRVEDAGRPIWIEPSIIDLALLYSLNADMLKLSQSRVLRRVQSVVKHLHNWISLFMRIWIRLPYLDVMDKLSGHIHILENSHIYGYEDERIQDQLRELGGVILAVVVIYGEWQGDGKTMFHDLLRSQRAIRGYMELDPTSMVPVDAWSEQVLWILSEAVRMTVNHVWHEQLWDLVQRLRRLGRLRRV
jgi:hypothetical protein